MDEPLTLRDIIMLASALTGAGVILWRLQMLFRRQDEKQDAALQKLVRTHATTLEEHRKASEEGRRRLYERMEAMDDGWEKRFDEFRQHCDQVYVHTRVHAAEMGAMRDAVHELNVNMMQISGRVCPLQMEHQAAQRG